VAHKNVKGILHIGAHECEELQAYINHGVSCDSIDWIEANPELVERMNQRNIKVHCAAIHNEEKELPF
jgi:spermidine synthase